MRILELIGKVLKPFHSDVSKLTESTVAFTDRPIEMKSPVFVDNGVIPIAYSDDGAKCFPTLTWTNIPVGTKSVILVVEDPDAPKPTPFLHGLIYNIPADFNEIPEAAFVEGKLTQKYLSVGMRLGSNSIGQLAYLPPSPPPGHGPHHYHFQLMALDTVLESDRINLKEMKDALDGHVLGAGDLVGIYER